MENRFGFKDLFLFLLVGGLIVLVVLQMKQYDRQWDVVQQVRNTVNDQTGDLARIRRILEQGNYTAGAGPTTAPAGGEVDARVRKTHSAPDYAPGDQLIDVLTAPPDKLTALINTDLYSMQIQGYVLDYLVDRDPVTLDWIPRLATSWNISDDGLTIDFNLRRGVTFSDGTPLTADDVVYSVGLLRNEKIEAPGRRVFYDKLAKVEKTDEYGVRFVYKEPYYMAFEVAGQTQVLSRRFYSKYTPEQINNSTGLLLGSGPYRLPDATSWRPEPGKPIVLVRNERYWGEPPGLNRLIWRVISLPAARMTALRNGEIDLYYMPSPEQFDTMKSDPELSRRLSLFSFNTLNGGYFFLGWNEKRGGKPTYFADLRVRRAMTMLVDRDKIIREILRGYASPCTGPFNPLSPQYDHSIKPFPYDPKAAELLLMQAGFRRENGGLTGPDGKQFSFDFMYFAGGDTGKRIATFIHDAMAQAGIVVRLAPSEWSVMLQRQKERDYDAVLGGWGGGAVEDDPQQIFTTDAISGVGDNYVQYSNPQLDAAIAKARTTMDEKKRMPLWHEVHRLIHEGQPYTFLFTDMELDAIDKRFKGVEETKEGLMVVKNEWYVPKSLQKYKD